MLKVRAVTKYSAFIEAIYSSYRKYWNLVVLYIGSIDSQSVFVMYSDRLPNSKEQNIKFFNSVTVCILFVDGSSTNNTKKMFFLFSWISNENEN